jgi:hypothetical protein
MSVKSEQITAEQNPKVTLAQLKDSVLYKRVDAAAGFKDSLYIKLHNEIFIYDSGEIRRSIAHKNEPIYQEAPAGTKLIITND